MAQPIRSDAARPSVPPQSPLVEDGNSPASAQAHEHLTDDEHGHDHAFDWQDGTRIAAVAVAAALVWFRVWEPFARVSVIGLVGTLIGIYPIFKEAVENISERRMTMELSMTIAILAALVIGQFFTALVIVLFVLIAEVLEDLTVRRGRTAIKDLLNLLPREVTVRRNGKPETISTDNIQVGEIIEVRPGGRIPVDGLVVSGNSFVDQSTRRIIARGEVARDLGICRHGKSFWRAGNSCCWGRARYRLRPYPECG